MKSDFVEAVEDFMKISGHLTDKKEFDVRQTALQMGLQLEEMAEKLAAVYGYRTHLGDMLMWESRNFKEGEQDGILIRNSKKADLLDADVDLAWVTIGSMLSQGADVLGAMGEVTRANLDKFPGGVVTKDGNGKICKPDGWRGPDLSPFVNDGSSHDQK